MKQISKWIWLYGDYEIFHSLLVHERRQEFGVDYPYFGVQSHVAPSVTFEKQITTTECGEVTFYVKGKAYIVFDGVFYAAGTPIRFTEGAHYIFIRVTNPHGLPALFSEGDIVTDESWACGVNGYTFAPVGATPAYLKRDDNLEIFPFVYEKKVPIDCKRQNGGWLYDFGRETFAKLYVETVEKGVEIYYGESEEEALAVSDPNPVRNALLFEKTDVNGLKVFPSRAFRYIFIVAETKPKTLYAEHEYLPQSSKSSFSCNHALVEQIFRVATDTFLLNSREFYLDGIKRDRWVWSGDAYQSFMINRYATNDAEIIKRTILALLGKPPYIEHINTINDYTFYLFISVYDYWYATGDTDFISKIFPRLSALYAFAYSRLDENGFVCKRNGDWVFLDWSDTLDKEGPICAEQILLWKATKCMEELSVAVGQSITLCDVTALREKIYQFYYKSELGGFIDGYVSGKNVINRQQNVFALLYGFVSESERKNILRNVLCNENIPPITTPYFKFFELIALCENGYTDTAIKMLDSYWGKMLALGATSFWERFDESQTGVAQYEMYNHAFGKSLCHAWGSGPIYILERYVAGVRITSFASETFVVQPRIDVYKTFRATVPVGDGQVTISLQDGVVRVLSNRNGGKLIIGKKHYPIQKDMEISICVREDDTI